MNIRPREGKVIAYEIYDYITHEFIIRCWTRDEARELASDCDGCVICAVRVSH